MSSTQQISKVDNAVCQGNPERLAEQAIENCAKSKQLMKQITAIILSSVFYFRKILPPETFIVKKMGLEKIYVLRGDNDHVFAQNLCEAIRSITEVIELGYLKTLEVTISDKEVPVERHILELEHDGNRYKSMIINQSTKNEKMERKWCIHELRQEIITAIKSFIYTLKVTHYENNHPMVVFKVDYFENVTPPDYMPRCFAPFDKNNSRHKLAKIIHIGDVLTPFHAIKIQSQFTAPITKKYLADLNFGMDTAPASQEENEPTKKNKGNIGDDHEVTAMDLTPSGSPNIDVTATTNNGNKTIFQETINSDINVTRFTEDLNVDVSDQTLAGHSSQSNFQTNTPIKQIRCPCQTEIRHFPLIECYHCGLSQHIYCFDIFNVIDAPLNHICDICAEKNSDLICTVPGLENSSSDEKLDRTIFRLGLAATYREEEVLFTVEFVAQLLQIDSERAEALLNQLVSMKALTRKPDGCTPKRLFLKNTLIPKYFRVEHNIKVKKSKKLKVTKDLEV